MPPLVVCTSVLLTAVLRELLLSSTPDANISRKIAAYGWFGADGLIEARSRKAPIH